MKAIIPWVLVIDVMIEMKLQLRVQRSPTKIHERPSSELLPHLASAGEVSLSVSPVLSPYQEYVRVDLLTNPSTCRTSDFRRDQMAHGERYSRAIQL